MANVKIPPDLQLWIVARKRHKLSHAQVQMARELGMNPAKLGKLDNHKQEPWKAPLPQYVEELYLRRFGKAAPENVVPIEERARELAEKKNAKKVKRNAKRAPERATSPPAVAEQEASPLPRVAVPDDDAAIRELVATWLRASKEGDVEKALSLMSEDVVFLVSGQPPMRGKAAFAAAQSGLRPFHLESTSEIQEIKVFADWAYVWTRLTVAITPREGGPSITRSGNTLSILQKQAGAWVVVRDANMITVLQA